MKKLAILSAISLLVLPLVMAVSYRGIVSLEIPLVEKNPVDWSEVPDGNCGGLDYTGDSMVNHMDASYVRRNKIDANNDGTYNSDDVAFMRDNYANCRAGKGVVEFSHVLVGPTWEEVAYQHVNVMVWNLEPVTEYTLVYYGNQDNNDVWPYATCIKTFKTCTQVYAKSTAG